MIFGKNINRYYLKYLPSLLLGLLALLVVDYMQLQVPRLYGMVINGVNNGFVELDGLSVPFDMAFLLDRICNPMLFIILTMIIGRFLWRVCLFGAGIKVETDIRRRLFSHAKDLSQEFYQVNKVGELMSLFTNDLETVQDCFGSGILMMVDAVALGAMSLGKMGAMDLKLTLLSLIPMVAMLAAALIVGKYMTVKWEKRQEAFSRLSDFSQESFSGIAVIKAFVKEAKELSCFRKLNKENEQINVAYTRLSAGLNAAITLFIGSVMCIILGYGGYLVYRGVFNAGQLLEFISYFTAIIWPVMAVSELIEMHSKGKASMGRIDEFLAARQDVADRPVVTDPGSLSGKIQLKHLTFRYPGTDRDVLKDISFTIEPGEQVGLIGRTGAGKTTLVDLLLRTYNVPDGTVFLDDTDVNDMPIAAVRRSAAYVPQDNVLFSESIEKNVAFAVDGASHEQVTQAAALADVHDNIVSFPHGYETLLGERGVTISGGQKQRVSIARALMKDAAILILDDSVSAVDTATEKVILDNLRTTRRGKTTILIAHRISTVENMDKILFLDEGRLLDMGTHEELLSRCKAYANMVALQKLEEKKED